MNIEKITKIAQVCHETNRAYCQSIGDNTQQPWELAPDWQRKSAVSGVMFHLDNPCAGPSHSHNSWSAEKTAGGWKYGPVKDSEKKEHPCLVPYEELPLEQKVKDQLFIGVISAMKVLI